MTEEDNFVPYFGGKTPHNPDVTFAPRALPQQETFDDGQSLIPTESRFMAQRRYAALEGGAGYWALGRTPARYAYDKMVGGADDELDPNFSPERRAALVTNLTPAEKERWGKEFLTDLETTSTSEANLMYRVTYKRDVDSAVAALDYYDRTDNAASYVFAKTLSALGNYVTVDPLTTGSIIASLGTSSFIAASARAAAVAATAEAAAVASGAAAAGVATAATTVVAAPTRAVLLGSYLNTMNQTHGNAIRWGSVGWGAIDGTASGYGMWAGAQKDQELIYGENAQLDDNPYGEMTFGAVLGTGGGMLGAYLHAKQFKRGAKVNPFDGDPIMEAAAGTGTPVPTAMSVNSRLASAKRHDAFIDGVRRIPDLSQEAENIVGSSKALRDLGWETSEDLDELAEFVSHQPNNKELVEKLNERFAHQQANIAAADKHDAAMAKWKLENPGASAKDVDGYTITRVVEARLAGHKGVEDPKSFARALLNWADNREWADGVDGRTVLARWVSEVANRDEIVRLMEFRNWEMRQLAEEGKALTNAAERITALQARQADLGEATEAAMSRAKESAQVKSAFAEADLALREGKWSHAVQTLEDAQEQVWKDAQEGAAKLDSLVTRLNVALMRSAERTEDAVSGRLKQVINPAHQTIVEAQMVVKEITEFVARQRARLAALKNSINNPDSTMGSMLSADLKSLEAEDIKIPQRLIDRFEAAQRQLNEYDRLSVPVMERSNTKAVNRALASANANGREALREAIYILDTLPLSHYSVMDEAVLGLWKRFAKVAVQSDTTAVMSGRGALGVRTFNQHLMEGTMPLRPQMKVPGTRTNIPGMPKLKPGERLMSGADLINAEDRILVEEIAAAEGRLPQLPTNITFDEALAPINEDIAKLTRQQQRLSALAPTSDKDALAKRAALKTSTADRLKKAVAAKNRLEKQMRQVDKSVAVPAPPASPEIPLSPKAARQLEVETAHNKAVAIAAERDALEASGKGTAEEIGKLSSDHRTQVARSLATTASGRDRIRLTMVTERIAKIREAAAAITRAIDPDARFTPPALLRLNKELDALVKQEKKLTSAVAKSVRSTPDGRVRVFGKDPKTMEASAEAAKWQARRIAAEAAGDMVEADRITRDVLLPLMGDERQIAHYPTLVSRFLNEAGDGVVDDLDAVAREMGTATRNADGTITTADGVIHSPTGGRPAPIAPKPVSVLDLPTDADDAAVSAKLDDALGLLVGDDDGLRVANGNSVLNAMHDVPVLSGLKDGFRRMLTAGTGASLGVFSHMGGLRRAYGSLLAISNLIDSPLLQVKDWGGKLGLHLSSLHTIRARVVGEASRLLEQTRTMSRGLEGGWQVRIRAAMIRKDISTLSTQERAIAQLHVDFYERHSAGMREMGMKVPTGYVPSLHNTAWISGNRAEATSLLQDAFRRGCLKPTETLDQDILTRAGIPLDRYAKASRVSDLNAADAALYRTGVDGVTLDEAQRTISRMLGGVEEVTKKLNEGDNGLRRIRFNDMHVESGLHRKFLDETLTDPTLNNLWEHGLENMAIHYAEGAGLRQAINLQLFRAFGVRTTMSEVLHHAANRIRTQMRELGDEALEEEFKRTVLNLEEKIMHAYNMSGILRVRNTSRGDVAARGITAAARAGVGGSWGLQTTVVEIPKSIWMAAGKNGLIVTLKDLGAAIMHDRQIINDFGVALEGAGQQHRSTMPGMDDLTGSISSTVGGRFAAPWKRTWGIATGQIGDIGGTSNRLVDTGVAALEALADNTVRAGGLHFASRIAREVAVRGANRQIFRLASNLPEIAAEVAALTSARGRLNSQSKAALKVIADKWGIDVQDLARMNHSGLLTKENADSLRRVLHGVVDDDELFDIYRVRNALGEGATNAVVDYMDEAAHVAVPTSRTSSAMTSRNNNWASRIFFMLTSYTRAFGTQNMIRLGAQTGKIQALGAFGTIYAGEVLYQHMREIYNGRDTVENIVHEWQTNPDKQMYKAASRIPFAGMYTSIGLNLTVEDNQSKSFGGAKPAFDLIVKARDAGKSIISGKVDKDAEALLEYLPVFNAWHTKSILKAYGLR